MIAAILKTDIETFAERMRRSPLLRLAQQGRVSPQAVAAYLTSILSLIRHTPIYLERARVRAEHLGERELADYFATKLREETGHDRWAENDVASLSSAFAVVTPERPLPSVSGLIGYLRSAIDDDPARYLAYILFAEYFTVLLGPEWISALENNCGVASSSMSVVERHVELDRRHVREGLAEIDLLVRDAARIAPIRETLERSMAYFSGFCDELVALAA